MGGGGAHLINFMLLKGGLIKGGAFLRGGLRGFMVTPINTFYLKSPYIEYGQKRYM